MKEDYKDRKLKLAKWNFREEKYSNIVLTDKLEIYILELPKCKMKVESENINLWINFIKNLEVSKMSEKADKSLIETVEAIEEAQKKLDELNENEEARYIAHLRDKYVRDANSLKNSGYKEGEKMAIERIARKLKSKYSIEEIIEITGLTKEEIAKL